MPPESERVGERKPRLANNTKENIVWGVLMNDEHENISTGMVLLYNCTGPALIILKKDAVNTSES